MDHFVFANGAFRRCVLTLCHFVELEQLFWRKKCNNIRLYATDLINLELRVCISWMFIFGHFNNVYLWLIVINLTIK